LRRAFSARFFNTDDESHLRVREVAEERRGQPLRDLLVTTPHVIFETLTFVRNAQREGKPSSEMRHRNAVRVGEHLLAGTLARLHRPSEEDERRAFEYFRKHKDQEYSMVDCLSFVVMDQLGITEAWAVDRDFTHRFIARPGPKPSELDIDQPESTLIRAASPSRWSSSRSRNS
jgi:predicted nucleic acid-binding protein